MRETKKHSRSTAFTLIELLIVVAIIAILAAVAVPNFLEAQVRSKVAAVKADMRTIDTAISSYTIDYNRPPIGMGEGETLYSWGSYTAPDRGWRTWPMLTTPIAYLSSIPTDVFVRKTGPLNNRNYRTYFYWNFQGWLTDSSGSPLMSHGRPNSFYVGLGYTWFLRSWGPMMTAVEPYAIDILAGQLAVEIYDPTNGSRSSGKIIRTNRGFYGGPGS